MRPREVESIDISGSLRRGERYEHSFQMVGKGSEDGRRGRSVREYERGDVDGSDFCLGFGSLGQVSAGNCPSFIGNIAPSPTASASGMAVYCKNSFTMRRPLLCICVSPLPIELRLDAGHPDGRAGRDEAGLPETPVSRCFSTPSARPIARRRREHFDAFLVRIDSAFDRTWRLNCGTRSGLAAIRVTDISRRRGHGHNTIWRPGRRIHGARPPIRRP